MPPIRVLGRYCLWQSWQIRCIMDESSRSAPVGRLRVIGASAVKSKLIDNRFVRPSYRLRSLRPTAASRMPVGLCLSDHNSENPGTACAKPGIKPMRPCRIAQPDSCDFGTNNLEASGFSRIRLQNSPRRCVSGLKSPYCFQ